jgi:hypothetical protein
MRAGRSALGRVLRGHWWRNVLRRVPHGDDAPGSQTAGVRHHAGPCRAALTSEAMGCVRANVPLWAGRANTGIVAESHPS